MNRAYDRGMLAGAPALLLVVLMSATCSGGGTVEARDGGLGDGIPAFVLYPLGGGSFDDPGREPLGMHVDADGVYWLQKDGWVYRGSRDGSKRIEPWVKTDVVFAHTFFSDAERVYWFALASLRFKDKRTGEEGRVELPWDHAGGALAADDTYVYAAMWGCPAITRIHKRTLVTEEMDIPGIVFDPMGGTSLILHDGGFLCGAWTHVHWIPGWEEPAVQIVSSARRLWGMVVVGDDLYWLNNPGSSTVHTFSMSRISLSSGAITDFPESGWGEGNTNLIVSPDRRWLFFAGGTPLYAFGISDGTYRIALPMDPSGERVGAYGRELRDDGDALYYYSVHYKYRLHSVPFAYLARRLDGP
jgi:hypothetical protein